MAGSNESDPVGKPRTETEQILANGVGQMFESFPKNSLLGHKWARKLAQIMVENGEITPQRAQEIIQPRLPKP